MNGEVAHIGWLGYVVLTIVMGSLFFIILAAIGGNPRKPKVTLLVIATIIGLFVAVVASMGVGGFVFSVLMG